MRQKWNKGLKRDKDNVLIPSHNKCIKLNIYNPEYLNDLVDRQHPTSSCS